MEHDDIPPIDVLEAAARREREETEELLAGFDRPGRSPRRLKKADFVAHYSGEADAGEEPRREEPDPEAQNRRKPTFVLPRQRALPAWAPWTGLAALMILFGGLVAFLATAEPTATAPAPTSVPRSTTTITSAQKAVPTTRVDDVPPPPPSEAAPSAAPVPSSPRPRETVPAPSGPTPREDFIRRF